MRKYIITGGPGTGKTSTIEDLKKKGFYVVSETAREVIEHQLATNGKIVPWIDLDAFNKEVLKIQNEKEKTIPEDVKIVFLDRGIIDALGYYSASNRQPIPELIEAIPATKYEIVFILDQLPNYINDKIRKENQEKANALHKEIEKAYKNLGFNIINIPVASIEERTKTILNYLKQN